MLLYYQGGHILKNKSCLETTPSNRLWWCIPIIFKPSYFLRSKWQRINTKRLKDWIGGGVCRESLLPFASFPRYHKWGLPKLLENNLLWKGVVSIPHMALILCRKKSCFCFTLQLLLSRWNWGTLNQFEKPKFLL